jgi:putative DNA methylase
MSADDHPVISPKKLIEVAIPLDSINAAAAHEKAIRTGHPANLHLWWARRPLAAARAVIFSQLVNDPEDLWWLQNPGSVPNKQVRGHWTKTRQRLFNIIEDLVLWKNTTNEEVLDRAREEIRKSWREVCDLNRGHPQAPELFNPDKIPGLHDPFAGGGAIPLEAQRLGLEAFATDLNPVAVLINKLMIEIPPKFIDLPPVHPDARRDERLFNKEWKGAEGMAEDVRRYGQWIRDEAEKRIGHLYPKVEITAQMAKERPDLKPFLGQKLTVIAWIWARTVKSPNPAFSHVDVPLAGTFVLSTKPSKEAYVEIVKRGADDNYDFRVCAGDAKGLAGAKHGTKFSGSRSGFKCALSNSPIPFEYVREEGKAGRIGHRLMAIVAEAPRGRIYLSPIDEHRKAAAVATPDWTPSLAIAHWPGRTNVVEYGLTRFEHLFTNRQLVTLSTLTKLVQESLDLIRQHTGETAKGDGAAPNSNRRSGYAEAICSYLACGVSKVTNRANAIATWMPSVQCPGHLFSRQAIPMSWDFVEGNTLSGPSGSLESMIEDTSRAMSFFAAGDAPGFAGQLDAATQTLTANKFVSADPPYFDNIAYAELSDFFYVWLRRMLHPLMPTLFATLAVPKAEELVASPYRHGGKEQAESFFLDGMRQCLRQVASQAHPAAPVTIYYAFKQSDTEEDTGTTNSGWETFLAACIEERLELTGTWPLRTERENRKLNQDMNALASSVVLACRPRPKSAGTVSRRQFVRLLNETLPSALAKMTGADEGMHSPVAPVDLSQAIIGPGMAIFSRYDAVLEADGTSMTVKTALQLINRFLAEDDFDGDTQFCLHWFDQHGWEKAKFGEADTLARAKGTSVDGVKAAGVIESGGGNVRLLKWREYPVDWNASLDTRLPVWEVLHQLIRAYSSKGDAGAGKVLKACAGKAEAARQLAYRLYTLCERKGWAEDARAYNEVVTGWSGIEKAAGTRGEEQRELFGEA